MGWKNVNVIIEDKLLLGKYVFYTPPFFFQLESLFRVINASLPLPL